MIDGLTIVPVYIDLFLDTESGSYNFFRILRILRIVRIMRAFNTIKNTDQNDEIMAHCYDSNSVSKQIMTLVLTIFSVLFIGAGVLHALNQNSPGSFICNGDFDFLTAFYYTIVSTSTVGYGDVLPTTTTSRMIVIVMILTMVYVISDQLAKVSQLVGKYSMYDKRHYLADHIIVMGFYTNSSLSRFLSQFYHLDHGKSKARCIVIGSEYPNEELIKMFEGIYKGNVKYLQGDPLNRSSLDKANAYMAESIFIITNQNDHNLESNDMSAILITKTAQHCIPYTQIYLQLVTPYPINIAKFAPWHTIISIQNIKMSILGLSVYNQGFSTLISSLCTTIDSKIPCDLQNSS